jgi:hypothetical protein
MAYVRLNIVLNDYFAEDDLSDLMKERGWQSAGGRVTGKGEHDVDFLKKGEPMSDVALTGLLLELKGHVGEVIGIEQWYHASDDDEGTSKGVVLAGW